MNSETNEALKIEVYKEMKTEFNHYLFEIQKLWNYKFLVIGAVISIAVFNNFLFPRTESSQLTMNADPERIANLESIIPIIGLLITPILALAIDLKTLELGLHVRVLSDNIRSAFPNQKEIQLYETNIWSSGEAKNRAIFTLINSVGTSIIILFSSYGLVIFLKPGWALGVGIAGIILLLLPIIVGRIFYAPLFRNLSRQN